MFTAPAVAPDDAARVDRQQTARTRDKTARTRDKTTPRLAGEEPRESPRADRRDRDRPEPQPAEHHAAAGESKGLPVAPQPEARANGTAGGAERDDAADARHSYVCGSFTSGGRASFTSGSPSSDEDVPLSMRFIHKPLRAQEELTKASDPTRRNLAINAGRVDPASLDTLPQVLLPSPVHQLVRKKLGQIVKLLMKEHAIQRSRSLPLTPTYKLVHFGTGPDVKYFSQADRPAAILALNSPVSSDSDDDYNDLDDIDVQALPPARAHPHQTGSHPGETQYPGLHHPAPWLVEVLNLPGLSYHESTVVRQLPVFLENMFILSDQHYVLGQVAVRNIAYQKSVTVRYSTDAWATVVEVPAVYVPDAQLVLRNYNYDRFLFKIDLARFAQSPIPLVYQMCVRYAVPGQVYWDNNGGANYAVRLEHRPPAIPLTAKSKTPAHRSHPKYSSSFLKRVNSDLAIANDRQANAAATKAEANTTVPTAAPLLPTPPFRFIRDNFRDLDFDRNDYYLLSPLLTSLGSDALDIPRIKQGARAALPSPSPNLRTRARVDEPVSPTSAPTSPEISPAPAPVSLTHRNSANIGSMTYKQLLDSYCFFSAPSRDSSSTTLVLSEEQNEYDTTPHDPAVQRPSLQTTDPDAPFTVSSFLRG